MNTFNGFNVPGSWQEELANRLRTSALLDVMGDILKGLEEGELVSGPVAEYGELVRTLTAMEAVADEIALVSCDMACEEGL